MAVSSLSEMKGSESAISGVARRRANAECRMQNADFETGQSFCILHSAFCIRSSRPVKRRAPMQSTPQCREAHQHSRLDAPIGDALVIEDRQRSRGGVAIALDVVRHFLRREGELLGHAL